MSRVHGTDGKFVESHGQADAPEYGVWGNMIYRCHTPSAPNYSAYGGRGISVCDRWRYSFEEFLADMGPRPEGASIERKDNDGPYSPSNCCWATAAEQAQNRRNTRRIFGMTMREAAALSGLNVKVLKKRFDRGWQPERILSQPVRDYPEVANANC